MLLHNHQQLQQVAYKSPLAHKVVDERVDRTVALENGEMREGLISCKTSRNYFWRKKLSQLRFQIPFSTKILPESLLPLHYFNLRIKSILH